VFRSPINVFKNRFASPLTFLGVPSRGTVPSEWSVGQVGEQCGDTPRPALLNPTRRQPSCYNNQLLCRCCATTVLGHVNSRL